MNKIKHKIISCIRQLKLAYSLLIELLSYGKRLFRYNASIRTDLDIAKMQYTILRENHVIEKGMSMRAPRKGFGQEKVSKLLSRLQTYYLNYGHIDKGFLIYPLSTIKEYISYTNKNGTEIHHIEKKYHNTLKICIITEDELNISSGIQTITKEEIITQSHKSFKDLVQSRHSIRYYLPTPPKKEDIEEALKIAQQTPSACNRQSWRTHVFMNQDSTSLLEQQGGANGFESEILCTILVTADMKAFLSYEPMQCYVDGGLYSMNLINALHSLGYGTIPLSCGFQQKKLDNIAKNFGIPDNEAMICMIGVGVLHDTLNIAVSHRKDITLTNTYHS